MGRAEGQRERGREGRPRPRERGKPSAAREGQTRAADARGKPSTTSKGKPARRRARGKPEPPRRGQTRTEDVGGPLGRASGKPMRAHGGRPRPAMALCRAVVRSSVIQFWYPRTMGLSLFFRARKRGKQFSLPLAPWGCVLSEEPTRTHSRALNQTALRSHPCVALSSVG